MLYVSALFCMCEVLLAPPHAATVALLGCMNSLYRLLRCCAGPACEHVGCIAMVRDHACECAGTAVVGACIALHGGTFTLHELCILCIAVVEQEPHGGGRAQPEQSLRSCHQNCKTCGRTCTLKTSDLRSLLLLQLNKRITEAERDLTGAYDSATKSARKRYDSTKDKTEL